jgi:hypothetical protein
MQNVTSEGTEHTVLEGRGSLGPLRLIRHGRWPLRPLRPLRPRGDRLL